MAKKILLADDSLTIQKVVELTFSDSDYELVCVSNGQRALEKVREDRPDLILADVVMPEKNGYEVCEAIKGDPSTSRIPVVLLSGTFEPFDRERAGRIGADAIVSKPFDSQQLLAQVDALIDRAPAAVPRPEPAPMPQTTAAIAIPPVAAPPAAASAAGSASEEAPFDVGFSAEDFTAAIRLPPARSGMDPFEEEYGRGDVDSAIEAFEKAHPRFGLGSELESSPGIGDLPLSREDSPRDPQWLSDEPEKPAFGGPADDRTAPLQFGSAGSEPHDPSATVAIRRSHFPPTRADQMPTMEFAILPGRRGSANTEDAGADAAVPYPVSPLIPGPSSSTVEITAHEASVLFDVGTPPAASGDSDRETLRETEPERETDPEGMPVSAEEPVATAQDEDAVPGEIEMLAQRSSIPELTQMLSSVRSGGDMSDEQLDRLAARVVEKLSDRIVREIAWEVIPDMAEIVIKQRIKELESGIE
jgi:CheY-like chemotaxis protein